MKLNIIKIIILAIIAFISTSVFANENIMSTETEDIVAPIMDAKTQYNEYNQPPSDIILAEPNNVISEWANEYVKKAISLEFIPDDLQNSYTMLINRNDFCRIAYTMLLKCGKSENV